MIAYIWNGKLSPVTNHAAMSNEAWGIANIPLAVGCRNQLIIIVFYEVVDLDIISIKLPCRFIFGLKGSSANHPAAQLGQALC